MAYTLYHIKGKKWGCTKSRRLSARLAAQGYTIDDVYEFEKYDDIYEASNRELELQRRDGYPVDTHPYWKVVNMATTTGRKAGGKKGGKAMKGRRSNRAKLDDRQVRFIRKWCRPNGHCTQQRIANLFGINRVSISDIIQYKSYKDVI